MVLAVPIIEPPPVKPPTKSTDDPAFDTAKPIGYESLFPKGAWQLDEPKVINIDSARILWKTYESGKDGWITLSPATMILLPDDPKLDMAERIRTAVVMEVPDGAKLRFDPPLVIGRVKDVHLIEGKLLGNVTIRSKGKAGSPQGDLLVHTSDVSMTEQRIWTPNKVDFHWGPHFGVGRQMEIKLLPKQGPASAGNQSGPNVGGIEECDFQEVERLHLDMSHVDHARAGSAAAGGNKPSPGQPVMPFFRGPADSSGPVEVTCKGPFHFNLVQQVAQFNDQVDVFRTRPIGPSDHLSCDQLSVFFTHAGGTAGAAAKPGQSGVDLKPQRMEARGRPAVLLAPVDQMSARGEHLSYDLGGGEIVIDGGQEVTIKKDTNEIHARNLHYTPSKETGRLGTIVSQGPGTLHAQMADRAGQVLDARWNDCLKVLPKNQNDIISLTGGASLKFDAMGTLDSKEIYFWLKDRPPQIAGEKNELVPDRLLAQGEVRGDSPKYSMSVDRMEVWFTTAPMAAPAAGPPLPPGEGRREGRSQTSRQYAEGSRQIDSRTPAPPLPTASYPPPTNALPEEPQRHMEIVGRLLQARVVMTDRQKGDLTEATVIDNVVLRETRTAQPGDIPLIVTGQRLAATNANTPQAKVVVIGEPAHMEGRSLKLTGPVIELDRGTNRLTMHGPGEMELPIDRDMKGQPLVKAQPLQVDWQTQMTFDGLTAEFNDGVIARSNTQVLQTKLLKMRLQHAVSFSGDDSQQLGQPAGQQERPKPEEILCDGGAYIENRGFDVSQQMQTSLERMQLTKLVVNLISGDINGTGPGWLVSVRRGETSPAALGGQGGFGGGMNTGRIAIPQGPQPAGPGGPRLPAVPFGPQADPAGGDPAAMKCLHMTFLGNVQGNINRKEMTFHKRVRAKYANAASWLSTLESDDPAQLGPQAVVLQADHLTVVDLSANAQSAGGPGGGNTSSDAELLATDNVLTEGADFTARSARLSYSQRKDLLIFQGDGRTDAEFFQQKQEGGTTSHFSAQEIKYFLKTRQVNVDGARSLDIPNLPNAARPGGR